MERIFQHHYILERTLFCKPILEIAESHCMFCNIVILSYADYQSHMHDNHGLPLWSSNDEAQSSSKPYQAAIIESWKRLICRWWRWDAWHLIDRLLRKKLVNDELILEHRANIYRKTLWEPTITPPVHVQTMLYLNSTRVVLDCNGLTRDEKFRWWNICWAQWTAPLVMVAYGLLIETWQ